MASTPPGSSPLGQSPTPAGGSNMLSTAQFCRSSLRFFSMPRTASAAPIGAVPSPLPPINSNLSSSLALSSRPPSTSLTSTRPSQLLAPARQPMNGPTLLLSALTRRRRPRQGPDESDIATPPAKRARTAQPTHHTRAAPPPPAGHDLPPSAAQPRSSAGVQSNSPTGSAPHNQARPQSPALEPRSPSRPQLAPPPAHTPHGTTGDGDPPPPTPPPASPTRGTVPLLTALPALTTVRPATDALQLGICDLAAFLHWYTDWHGAHPHPTAAALHATLRNSPHPWFQLWLPWTHRHRTDIPANGFCGYYTHWVLTRPSPAPLPLHASPALHRELGAHLSRVWPDFAGPNTGPRPNTLIFRCLRGVRAQALKSASAPLPSKQWLSIDWLPSLKHLTPHCPVGLFTPDPQARSSALTGSNWGYASPLPRRPIYTATPIPRSHSWEPTPASESFTKNTTFPSGPLPS